MTETELRQKKRITMLDAARYLGMPIDKLRARAKRNCYSFIEAEHAEGSQRWSFWINCEGLIRFKAGELIPTNYERREADASAVV